MARECLDAPVKCRDRVLVYVPSGDTPRLLRRGLARLTRCMRGGVCLEEGACVRAHGVCAHSCERARRSRQSNKASQNSCSKEISLHSMHITPARVIHRASPRRLDLKILHLPNAVCLTVFSFPSGKLCDARSKSNVDW
jgi:hypothetical protein